MKVIRIFLFLAAISCASAFAADMAEQEIKNQLTAFTAAFNKSDAKAIAGFFAPDGTLINPAGQLGKGPAAITSIVQHDLDTILRNAKSEMKLESVRSLSPDLAFLDATHEITMQKQPNGMQFPPIKMHVAAVAKKIGGKWMWLDVRPYPQMSMGPHPLPGGMAPPPPHGMGTGMMPPRPGQPIPPHSPAPPAQKSTK